MKKRLAMFMIMVLSVSLLAGCGAKESKDNGGDGQEAADGEKYTIGICQLVQHEALDTATQGFKDALIEKLGEDRVEFDEQNASGEAAACATIVNQFVSSDVDLILANATASLQAAAAATDTIPVLGTSITDYATALDMSDFSGTTGRNISGTSDLAPLEEQAAMIKELFPDAETVGLLFCSAEANSLYQVKEMEEYLKAEGYTTEQFSFSDSNDIASITASTASKSDVIYVPTDNTAASNAEIINNTCLPAKVPVITGEEGPCKIAGVATLSISYYDIGYRAGEMAYEILENDADITTMEIETSPTVTKKYVASRSEELNVTIPEDYEEIPEE